MLTEGVALCWLSLRLFLDRLGTSPQSPFPMDLNNIVNTVQTECAYLTFLPILWASTCVD